MSRTMKKALGSVRGGSRRGLFEALELAKGITAESRSLEVLNGPMRPRWLKEARSTPEKDIWGIDIEIILANDLVVPVNIKSSPKGRIRHILKRREINGRFIIATVVRPYYTDEQILESFTSAVRKYLDGKRRYCKKKKKQNKQTPVE